MPDIASMMGSLSAAFLQNPFLYLTQGGLVLLACLLLFLLFYTLRDVLLRTYSFPLQFLCIVLVVALPGVGFLIYLLIRPARTKKERQVEAMLLALSAHLLPAASASAPEQGAMPDVSVAETAASSPSSSIPSA